MMQIWLRWKNSSCLCLLVINNKERKWNTHRTYKTGKIDVFLFIMSTASFYFMSMFVADKCVLTGFNEYSDPFRSKQPEYDFKRIFPYSIGHRTLMKNFTAILYSTFISCCTRIGSSQVQFIITDFSNCHSVSVYGQLQNSAQYIISSGSIL